MGGQVKPSTLEYYYCTTSYRARNESYLQFMADAAPDISGLSGARLVER